LPNGGWQIPLTSQGAFLKMRDQAGGTKRADLMVMQKMIAEAQTTSGD
jgi:hypothetical protein